MANAPPLSPQDMQRLSGILFRMSHDEKTRADTARVMARIDPQSAKAFGDVFLNDRLAEFKRQIDTERLQEKAKEAQSQQRLQRAKLAENYSEDQIVEIEKKVMTPLGLSDYIAASKIYAADNPPVRPELIPPDDIASGGATWDFPTVPGKDGKMLSFEDFAKNPVKASREAAMQVITEFKRNRLPGGFAHAR
jgi:hypothetical protein